jgi:hypothetical protein
MAGKYIELRQQRDFGEVLNASFDFITSNFGNLFKVIFTIVGPVFVTAIAFLSFFGYRLFDRYLQDNSWRNFTYRYSSDSLFNGIDYIMIALTILALFAGVILMYITTYGYIKLYNEKRSSEIETREVWSFVKKNLLRYMASGFAFTLFFIILIAFMVLIFSFGYPLLIFFGIIGFMAVFIYQSLFFAIITFEGFNPVNGIARGFNLVWGKWWFTLGIIIVMTLLSTVINSAVQYGGAMLFSLLRLNSYDEMPSWLARASIVSYAVLVMVCYVFLGALSIVKDAVLYFSFTEEKENMGLMEKLHMIAGESNDQPEITVEKNKAAYSSEENEEEY